jgi:hypothetical protein
MEYYEDKIRELVVECSVKTRKAMGRYLWPDGTDVWPYEDSQKQVSHYREIVVEELGERETKKPGYSYLEGGKRHVLIDVIEGKEWVADEEGNIYVGGILEGKSEIEKDENGDLDLQIVTKNLGTIQYVKTYRLEKYDGDTEILTEEEIRHIQELIQGAKYKIEHEQWRLGVKYKEIVQLYELTSQSEWEKFIAQFECINNTGTDQGEWIYRIKDVIDREVVEIGLEKLGWKEFMDIFPYYEEETLISKYHKKEDAIITDEHKALIDSLGYASWTGKYLKGIRYYAEGLYKIIEEGINYPELKAEGYQLWTEKRERTEWDSGDDFSTGNLVKERIVYETKVSGNVIDEIKAEDEELDKIKNWINDENTKTQRSIATVENLYGGENLWYYGIWFGDKIFNEAELKKTNTTKEEYDNKREELLDKVEDFEIKEKEEGVSSLEKPAVTLPTYIKMSKNDQEVSGWELEKDHESDRLLGREVLIGPVTTKIIKNIGMGANGEMTVITSSQMFSPYIEKNLIHANRNGGMTLYSIPGADVEYGGEISAGIGMPILRKSKNEGIDVLEGIQIIGMEELMVSQVLGDVISVLTNSENIIEGSDNFKEVMDSIGVPNGKNENTSWMVQSVEDINGDSIADIVQEGNGTIRVTPGGKNGFGKSYEISGKGEKLSEYETNGVSYSTSFNAIGNVVHMIKSIGKAIASKLSGGDSGHKLSSMKDTSSPKKTNIPGDIKYADGGSNQRGGFVDMNGDGLPDYMEDSNYLINIGDEFRQYEKYLGTGILSKSRLSTIGVSMSISPSLGDKEYGGSGKNSGSVSGEVSGSISYSVSASQTNEMLFDMNGDGLPDKIRKNGDHRFEIAFNQGDKFSDPMTMNGRRWDMQWYDYPYFQFTTDGNIVTDWLSSLPLVNNSASPSLIDSILKGYSGSQPLTVDGSGFAINPFGAVIENYANGLDLSMNIDLGISASIMGSIDHTIEIPLPPPLLVLFIKINAETGGGINAGTTLSGISVEMVDINGDGLVDRVLRVPGSNRIYVQLNRLGGIGLLERVVLP